VPQRFPASRSSTRIGLMITSPVMWHLLLLAQEPQRNRVRPISCR
jgi:hypothetical protein